MGQQENMNIIKKHLTQIFEQESKKYQIVPIFFVFNKEQFLRHRNFFARVTNKYKLVRDNSILDKVSRYLEKKDFINSHYFATTSGFTNGKNITILLHDDDLEDDLHYSLYFRFEALFHEFKHIEQREQRKDKHILKNYITDFDTFRNLIEADCRKEVTFAYKLLYDDFYSEIEADIYGKEKAHEYCSKNNVFSYGGFDIDNHLKLLTYDFDKFLKIYHNLVYRDPIYRATNKLSSDSTYSVFF